MSDKDEAIAEKDLKDKKRKRDQNQTHKLTDAQETNLAEPSSQEKEANSMEKKSSSEQQEKEEQEKEEQEKEEQEKEVSLNEEASSRSIIKQEGDLDEIKQFLYKGERIISYVRYEGKLNRVKIVGQTNKRSFGYRSMLNRKRFVSSRRSISHIEFGKWRIPIWLWLILGLTFVPPILMMSSPELSSYSTGLLVLPSIVLIFCLIYRKFTYLGTAIGSQFFHIITRKPYLLKDATDFIRILHLQKYFNKPQSERYMTLNYFGKWIRIFIILVAVLTLISWIIITSLSAFALI
jgi:flagellar biosynthesis GTPase FlhF